METQDRLCVEKEKEVMIRDMYGLQTFIIPAD